MNSTSMSKRFARLVSFKFLLLHSIQILFKTLTNKRAQLKSTISLIFDAIDTDKSGEISRDEFANYFKSINVDDSQVIHSAFVAMDSSGDDAINKEGTDQCSWLCGSTCLQFLPSVEEFELFAWDFFFCEDEANPAKNFFGSLD